MTNKYKLRFVPLGGVVGVNKNMYLYELYKDNSLQDILIVDCGIGFPKERELGVDLVIPDISYLKDKIDKIRGVLLSHGHEDHTSALPYLYHDLGRPKVYTSKLTSMFLQRKCKEFNVTADINLVNYDQVYKFGDFQVEFIRVTHSIPDTLHILIKTPLGSIYHGTDFKFDLTPPYGKFPDFYKITKAGHHGILCLLSDCLGAEEKGLTLSESAVSKTIEDEMRKTKGKFIMTTFSSNISRIRQCVEMAIKFNKKIVFIGRSMIENSRLAQEKGYLPIPKNLIATEKDLKTIPSNKICLIVAGSQGQFDSALNKMANGQNRFVKITPGDKIIFSSDPIPGNEVEVYSLIEQLTLQGAEVVYSDIRDQLHASGHGSQEDLKFLIRFTQPKYFIPIGGTPRHQRQYKQLTEKLGYLNNSAFLLNEGDTVWFDKNKAYKGEIIETKSVYIDAYGIGDVGHIVLRDRKTLSSDGIVVVVLVVDKFGKLVTKPEIISRGFVFEKVEKQLFNNALNTIEQILKPKKQRVLDLNKVKGAVIKQLENLFYKQKGRKPLVIVEAIQV